ncbi:alkaline phosphatase family protein, partial [Vibrio parahaemolyticus]|nr:alkaline phosphatase family protein [Vibrio parahaemolyticus]
AASEINLWLVSSEPVEGTFQVFDESGEKLLYQAPLSLSQQQQVGEHAFVALWHFAGEYPTNCALFYQIHTQAGAITELVPHLCYEGDETKGIAFSVRTTADYILHGSCRNPHHRSADALVAADKKVASLSPAERPDLLLL